MSNIDNDIYKTRDIVDQWGFNRMDSRYNKVYFSSNEDLKSLFSDFDLEGKRVLSVLASGDQAFHFYNRGVKTLDVFDVNKLTIYYFYLRIWTIKYLNHYYPPHNLNDYFFKRLLSYISPACKEEEDAYKYWSLFYKDFDQNAVKRLFLMNTTHIHSPNKIDNLETITSRIQNKEFDFYNINISKEISIDKKYDVVYTSNIHEYLPSKSLNVYRDNLYSLLSKNGIVISADFHTSMRENRAVFEDLFIYHDIEIGLESKRIGHYYVKKKIFGK